MASKIDAVYFRLRAMQTGYRSLVYGTQRWLNLRLAKDCYVSWSAGKDSTVVAHLCRQIMPDIPILMVDPGVPIHWTAEDRARMIAAAEAWNLKMFTWDKFAHARPESEADYRNSVHQDQFEQLTQWAQSNGLTRRVTGIRASESKGRSNIRAQTHATLQPICHWSTEDVWTYILEHELPWLSIYDHLGPDARNGLIGRNGREHGRFVYLKRFYPEAYRLACELFPEARTHV